MSILPTHIAFVLVWSIAINRNRINKTSNSIETILYISNTVKVVIYTGGYLVCIFYCQTVCMGIKYEDA